MDCFNLSAMLSLRFLDTIKRLKVHPKLGAGIQKAPLFTSFEAYINIDVDMGMDFTVEFYETAGGVCPVRDFLDTLKKSDPVER